MDEPHLPAPIPEQFYNSETRQPFNLCMLCNTSLAETQYLIEKAYRNFKSFRKHEVIFEYATCIACASKMHMELSQESRARVQEYLIKNIKKENHFNNLNDALGHCAVKGTLLQESAECSIYALCNGNQMVSGDFPYALSGEAQDEIMQLLSAKSLDLLDDFIGNHFLGPPEVREILKRRPVLI